MDISTELAKKMLEYLNSTEAFLQKNIPAFVEEYLTFYFYQSTFIIAFFLLLLVLSFSLSKISKKHIENFKSLSREDKEFLNVMRTVPFGILLLLNAFVIPININTLIKIKFAPRVYLVDELKDTLK